MRWGWRGRMRGRAKGGGVDGTGGGVRRGEGGEDGGGGEQAGVGRTEQRAVRGRTSAALASHCSLHILPVPKRQRQKPRCLLARAEGSLSPSTYPAPLTLFRPAPAAPRASCRRLGHRKIGTLQLEQAGCCRHISHRCELGAERQKNPRVTCGILSLELSRMLAVSTSHSHAAPPASCRPRGLEDQEGRGTRGHIPKRFKLAPSDCQRPPRVREGPGAGGACTWLGQLATRSIAMAAAAAGAWTYTRACRSARLMQSHIVGVPIEGGFSFPKDLV